MTPAELVVMLSETISRAAATEPLLDRKGLAECASCGVRAVDDWRRKGCPPLGSRWTWWVAAVPRV